MGVRERDKFGRITWEKLSESNTFAHLACVKRTQDAWSDFFGEGPTQFMYIGHVWLFNPIVRSQTIKDSLKFYTIELQTCRPNRLRATSSLSWWNFCFWGNVAQIWCQFANNFYGPPIFKIWQTTPNFQNITDYSGFPFSSQLKRLPDLKQNKKRSVVLIESCSPAISSTVASVNFLLILQDLAHQDVSSRLLSNLSNNRARNNGQSTDNFRTDCGFDRSNFRLAGHVERSKFNRIGNEINLRFLLFSCFSCYLWSRCVLRNFNMKS